MYSIKTQNVFVTRVRHSAIIRSSPAQAQSLPVHFWQCQHCLFKGSRSAATSALAENPAEIRLVHVLLTPCCLGLVCQC
ncbi:hypothetical protein QQF64_003107 [Cirrhinus molitorella]|uniref:Uncharacterized protein n=1 Tax=Cirrhinus molitorella TaxID=172907 RepID=A0ABR3MJ89_9TELE